jgi:hypothetical protein
MPSDKGPKKSNNIRDIFFSGSPGICGAGRDLEKFQNLFSQNLELSEKISNAL